MCLGVRTTLKKCLRKVWHMYDKITSNNTWSLVFVMLYHVWKPYDKIMYL